MKTKSNKMTAVKTVSVSTRLRNCHFISRLHSCATFSLCCSDLHSRSLLAPEGVIVNVFECYSLFLLNSSPSALIK